MKCDLVYIKANFACTVKSIKKLENSNLSLADSLNIVKQVETSVNELPTSANSTTIKTKFKNVSIKKGLKKILKIVNVFFS